MMPSVYTTQQHRTLEIIEVKTHTDDKVDIIRERIWIKVMDDGRTTLPLWADILCILVDL